MPRNSSAEYEAMMQASGALRRKYGILFRLKESDFKRVLLRALYKEAEANNWENPKNPCFEDKPQALKRMYKIHPF